VLINFNQRHRSFFFLPLQDQWHGRSSPLTRRKRKKIINRLIQSWLPPRERLPHLWDFSVPDCFVAAFQPRSSVLIEYHSEPARSLPLVAVHFVRKMVLLAAAICTKGGKGECLSDHFTTSKPLLLFNCAVYFWMELKACKSTCCRQICILKAFSNRWSIKIVSLNNLIAGYSKILDV
jgi:hypothetical protein